MIFFKKRILYMFLFKKYFCFFLLASTPFFSFAQNQWIEEIKFLADELNFDPTELKQKLLAKHKNVFLNQLRKAPGYNPSAFETDTADYYFANPCEIISFLPEEESHNRIQWKVGNMFYELVKEIIYESWIPTNGDEKYKEKLARVDTAYQNAANRASEYWASRTREIFEAIEIFPYYFGAEKPYPSVFHECTLFESELTPDNKALAIQLGAPSPVMSEDARGIRMEPDQIRYYDLMAALLYRLYYPLPIEGCNPGLLRKVNEKTWSDTTEKDNQYFKDCKLLKQMAAANPPYFSFWRTLEEEAQQLLDGE
jgi:hypothetical protein